MAINFGEGREDPKLDDGSREDDIVLTHAQKRVACRIRLASADECCRIVDATNRIEPRCLVTTAHPNGVPACHEDAILNRQHSVFLRVHV